MCGLGVCGSAASWCLRRPGRLSSRSTRERRGLPSAADSRWSWARVPPPSRPPWRSSRRASTPKTRSKLARVCPLRSGVVCGEDSAVPSPPWDRTPLSDLGPPRGEPALPCGVPLCGGCLTSWGERRASGWPLFIINRCILSDAQAAHLHVRWGPVGPGSWAVARQFQNVRFSFPF